MNNRKNIDKHLTALGAWAFSIGTSVGWGSLVVTASTYLAQAGPLGSVFGLIIGALIMFLIGRNYAYMMRCYPEAGGAYTFCKEVFGYDYGFLTSWFLAMTYFAVLWANATSLPLFSRIFLGDLFRFGKLYTIFNYDVYIGEALLSIAGLLIIGAICAFYERLTDKLMIGMAIIFSASVTICFLVAVLRGGWSLSPAFVENSSALSQIVQITVISPWAFIGFENISHASEEFVFDKKKIPSLMNIAIISTVLLYIMIILLSVSAYPAAYENWFAYIKDLDNLAGLEALPAFYAANRHLGNTGVFLLMMALLALVITSLIGNITALSRLAYAMAEDRILPERFSRINKKGVPSQAIGLIVAFSLFVPFLGRTTIGWIVDVTTIGATLIYGLVSAATYRMAKDMDDKTETKTGLAACIIMILFGAYFLLPTIIAKGSLAKETYLLFIVWSVLGFLYFRYILYKDKESRFGKSIVVWLALLSLVLLISLVWMRQSMIASNEKMTSNIHAYYEKFEGVDHDRLGDEDFIEEEIRKAGEEDSKTVMMAFGMFGFALAIMLTNHTYMSNRSQESEKLANTDSMTGVKNKHAYMLKEKEINDAIKDGTIKDFSIVVCDVNGLKKINDTLGHKAGDEYICKACSMICEIFKHSPIYRIGGDEFVAILSSRDHLIRDELMNVLHDQSVENIDNNGAVVSGGISDFDPEKDGSFHAVFERADAKMYEEKQLLKSMGAVTRDDESESDIISELNASRDIINVRKHILIVEDEEINRLILGKILEEDYEIIYAADGVEAEEIIEERYNELALILLDLKMPRMDGMELLRIIKSENEYKHIPVIILTADNESEVECLKIGAIDFISKPYPLPETIKARVNKCIELSEDRDIIRSTERDSLTKLFNPDYFMHYVNLFDQNYPDMFMDAIVVDVNRFHMINERYGKAYGDTILRRIGERIRSIARKIGGVGCHLTADTFYIYCPHQGAYDELLEKISSALQNDQQDNNRIHLRMGVYKEVDKQLDIERRFDRAKIAANTMRNSHADAVSIYNEKMHEDEVYKERLLEDFKPSIEQGCFKVFFQPKFDIRPAEPILSSAEALVRWDHPSLGMISPGVFIPLLEDNGLILDLDRFVWEKTAEQINSWKKQHGFSIPVSVNVSRIDMLVPNLKDIFKDILDRHGLSTDDIILEITESAYTGVSDQVISTARELRGMGMGFRIEMDDFGTGYSSLSMLSHLPIDALKLDMSFIRNAFGEKKDVRMIELIIDIADYLHVPVVAEGVETEEQYLMLKTMGCDLIQGYYFSKPVPAAEFDTFLIARGKQSVEVTPEVKKTVMSISKALTSNFENIYYIDTVTDFYLEFYKGASNDLKIRPGGSDFHQVLEEKILKDVLPEDREKLEEVLNKENIVRQFTKDDSFSITYRKKEGDEVKTYLLETIRTRGSDVHHLIIGICPK